MYLSSASGLRPAQGCHEESSWLGVETMLVLYNKVRCLLATEMRNVLSLHINAHIQSLIFSQHPGYLKSNW